MTHTPADHAHDDHSHDHDALAHPLPLWVLSTVFAALLVLTFITVAVTWVDLGPINIWIALVIAAVKAGIVGLYFMHLRYDSPVNGIILVVSLLFVAIFIGATIHDSREYFESLSVPTPISDTTAPATEPAPGGDH